MHAPPEYPPKNPPENPAENLPENLLENQPENVPEHPPENLCLPWHGQWMLTHAEHPWLDLQRNSLSYICIEEIASWRSWKLGRKDSPTEMIT